MTKRKRTNEECHNSKWTKLPNDILISISELVEPQWRIDFQRRLRAVCPSWRNALLHPPRCCLQTPLRLPAIRSFGLSRNVFLIESTIYLISPLRPTRTTRSWVMRVQETNPNKWHLVNPFSGADDLFHCTPSITADIDLSNYKIRELTKSYSLVERSGNRNVKILTSKVVALRVNDDQVTGLIVLALHNAKLYLWKYGQDGWITSEEGIEFADITVYKGNFYAVEQVSGDVCILDPSTLTTSNAENVEFGCVIEAPPEPPGEDDDEYELRSYLVQSRSQLYYVMDRFPIDSRLYHVGWIRANVMDNEGDWWEGVTHFDDQVFFLLGETTFSISATDLGRQLLEGRICFVTDPASSGLFGYCKTNPKQIQGLESMDSFGYLVYSQTLDECDYLEEIEGPSTVLRSIDKLRPIVREEYTSIFFPPPPWIEWHCKDGNKATVVELANLPFTNRVGSSQSDPSIGGYEFNLAKRGTHWHNYIRRRKKMVT